MLILRHWFRVDLRRSALGGCPHWLLSRDPALTIGQFEQWWCAGGVLCRVIAVAGSRPRCEVVWDGERPVPLPP